MTCIYKFVASQHNLELAQVLCQGGFIQFIVLAPAQLADQADYEIYTVIVDVNAVPSLMVHYGDNFNMLSPGEQNQIRDVLQDLIPRIPEN